MQTASMSWSSSSAFQWGYGFGMLNCVATRWLDARLVFATATSWHSGMRRNAGIITSRTFSPAPMIPRRIARWRRTLRAGRARARRRLDAGGAGAERRRHRQHAESEKLATPHRGGVRAIRAVCHAVPPGGAIDALSSTDATAEPDVGRRFSSPRTDGRRPSASRQRAEQREHVPDDGVPHRPVAAVRGHVVPGRRLARPGGEGRQRDANRDDVRGFGDVDRGKGGGKPEAESARRPPSARPPRASTGRSPGPRRGTRPTPADRARRRAC